MNVRRFIGPFPLSSLRILAQKMQELSEFENSFEKARMNLPFCIYYKSVKKANLSPNFVNTNDDDSEDL